MSICTKDWLANLLRTCKTFASWYSHCKWLLKSTSWAWSHSIEFIECGFCNHFCVMLTSSDLAWLVAVPQEMCQGSTNIWVFESWQKLDKKILQKIVIIKVQVLPNGNYSIIENDDEEIISNWKSYVKELIKKSKVVQSGSLHAHNHGVIRAHKYIIWSHFGDGDWDGGTLNDIDGWSCNYSRLLFELELFQGRARMGRLKV